MNADLRDALPDQAAPPEVPLLVFSTKPYDEAAFRTANTRHDHDVTFLKARVDATTVALANGAPVVVASALSCPGRGPVPG